MAGRDTNTRHFTLDSGEYKWQEVITYPQLVEHQDAGWVVASTSLFNLGTGKAYAIKLDDANPLSVSVVDDDTQVYTSTENWYPKIRNGAYVDHDSA